MKSKNVLLNGAMHAKISDVRAAEVFDSRTLQTSASASSLPRRVCPFEDLTNAEDIQSTCLHGL